VYACARECACVVCVCMHGFKHVIKHDTCMHTAMMLKGEVKLPKVCILGLRRARPGPQPLYTVNRTMYSG
jgi:hypothetical protein